MNIGQSKSTLGSGVLSYNNGSALWFLLHSHTKVSNSSVCVCVCVRTHAQTLSCVRLFATPWTVVHQAFLAMDISRQEYWSGHCI